MGYASHERFLSEWGINYFLEAVSHQEGACVKIMVYVNICSVRANEEGNNVVVKEV